MTKLQPGDALASSVPIDPILKLADEGMRVFPLRKGKKTPAVSWKTQATTDKPQIREWARMFPDCNWGLACGKKSGVFVLDLDGQGSQEWLKTQIHFYSQRWPVTKQVRTPRGAHLYFKYPADMEIRNSASQIAFGVDVRGEGGFVVVPPSIVAGFTYTEVTP